MAAERTFHPQTTRFPVPKGGRIRSDELGRFVESVTHDLTELSGLFTATVGRLEAVALATKLEAEDLRQRFRQLKVENDALRRVQSENGESQVYALSVYDSSLVRFLDGSAEANRAHVDTTFGLATVPLNGAEHRFMVENIRTGNLSPIPNLVIDVTGTFDAGDGEGVVNHEAGATLTEGVPEYAFNGNNTKRWIRKLEYDLYDDQTDVMTELTVTLPEQASALANLVYVAPFPEGDLDIVGIYSSPDLSSSFTLIPGFAEVLGAGPTKFLFPAQAVQRLKIRFRQRNWVEENGKKVFYVGAQEIGLQLLDWDKSYTPGDEVSENHSFVLVATAPEGFEFSKVATLFTDPMFDLETLGSRHLHVKIDTVGDGSDVIWDSDVDSLPQDMASGLSLTPVSKLYFIVTMNFVSSSGGPTSPFPVGTSPYLKSILFEAETTEE